MYRIRLVNAIFFAHHGATSEERQTGGRYEIDVEVGFDFEAAAREDNLDATLCYETVYRIAAEVVQDKKIELIERIAYLIANQVAELSAQIEYVDVCVRKRNPPVGGSVDFAEAVYRRDNAKTSSDR